jgi:hypothetical protein
MYNKILMLFWERWRRTRWILLLACIFTAFTFLSKYYGYHNINSIINPSTVIFFLCNWTIIQNLIVGHCELRNLDLALPTRLFKLPLSSTILLSVNMGYGIIAIALPNLIFFILKMSTLNHALYFLLIFETLYIVVQTLAWLGGAARFFILALFLLLVYAIFRITYISNLMDLRILLLIIILFCFAISHWSISQYRQGAWLNSWKLPGSFTNIFSKKPQKPFRSSIQAQVWFEMRKTGYLLPIAGLCLTGGIAIIPSVSMVIESYINNTQFYPMSEIIPAMFFFTGFAAVISGMLTIAAYYREYTSGSHIFWLRRPMSTQTLANANLYASLKGLAYLFVILLVLILAITVFDLSIGMFDIRNMSPVNWALKHSTDTEFILMSILGLFAFLISCWFIFRSIFLLCPPISYLLPLLFVIHMIPGSQKAISILCVILLIAVSAAFHEAKLRNLISTATIVTSACIFPLVALSIWAFAWPEASFIIPDGYLNLNRWQILIMLGASSLPFISVVVIPFVMDKIRHR